MNEDEIKGMLPSIPTAMLVQELNRRRDEWREAERSLGLGVPAPVSVTRRAKHVSTPVSNPMKDAAIERWRGWDEYRAKNKTATPKEFFAWKKRQS